MKKILLGFLIFISSVTSVFCQIWDQSVFSNQNQANSMCLDNDTIWVATTGGIVKWLKDGTLLDIITKDNGLPFNNITAITVDQNGDKWIGGNGGFAKFDGTTWTHFNLNAVNSFDVVVDPENRIWFGVDYGVYTYDSGSFQHIIPSDIGFNLGSVFSIAIDADGSIWFGGIQAVSHYDSGNWTSYTDFEGHVVSVKVDDDNNKWFAHREGFSKFDGINWTHFNKTDYPLLANIDLMSMAIEKDTIWLGTYDHGVIRFTEDTIEIFNSSNSDLLPGRVQDIYIDEDGSKYFSTGDLYREGGVSRYKNHEWKLYTTDSPFGHRFIMAINEDNEGNIWVGTYGGGVSKYNGENWTKYNTSNSSISNNTIYQIKIDKSGDVWAGTSTSLSKYSNNEWTNFTPSDGLNGRIEDIDIDQQGNIWVVTRGGGAAKFDGESWIKFNTSNCNIVSDDLYRIAVDSSNNIWIGSFDNGLSKFDGQDWTSFNTTNQMLGYDYIHCLEVDKLGNVWVGVSCCDASIYKYDGNVWIKYNTTNSGISQNFISAFANDNYGLYWFGYGERYGFGMYNGSEWFQYDVNNTALTDNRIYTIFCDSKDNIWIGGVGGITKFKYENSDSKILSIHPNSIDVSAQSGSTAFIITSNVSWSISYDADWIEISPTNGMNDTTLTVSYDKNLMSISRSAEIILSGTDVSPDTAYITQDWDVESIFLISPEIRNVSSAAGSTVFEITSNVSWSISYDADWIEVSPKNGTNDTTLTVSYDKNLMAKSRSAEIILSGTGVYPVTAHITQDWDVEPIFIISPGNQNVSNEAGSTVFEIKANADWYVNSESSWITLTPLSGEKDTLLLVNYESNTTGDVRTAKIELWGVAFSIVSSATITQDNYNSINEIELSNQIKVYPNPAKNKIYIDLRDFRYEIENLSLFNSFGKLLHYSKINNLNSGIIEISVSNYTPGLYHVNLSTKEGLVRKKVLIIE